jgi:hypothetical protein
VTPTRDLTEIFERLERVLFLHVPPFVARTGSVRGKRDLHLWSEKDVIVAGRPRSEVSFAAAIVQKGYVGFYFMPVYTNAEQKSLFAPELLALLKGKSCFYIKVLDGELLAHITDALEHGLRLYRERGWV